MRVKGHKRTLEHNGERSRQESAWTASCECGWEEHHSRKDGAAQEYSWHLQEAKRREQYPLDVDGAFYCKDCGSEVDLQVARRVLSPDTHECPPVTIPDGTPGPERLRALLPLGPQ